MDLDEVTKQAFVRQIHDTIYRADPLVRMMPPIPKAPWYKRIWFRLTYRWVGEPT